MSRKQKNDLLKRIPPVCIGRALVRFITGTLHFSSRYLGRELVMDDGKSFKAFRHLTMRRRAPVTGEETVFIVRFRFKRHSFPFNRAASIIPIPLIAGTPGIQTKLWVVDRQDGAWQGMYQFETLQAAEDYRESLVFRVMNRRAVSESLEYTVIPRALLSEFLHTRWT